MPPETDNRKPQRFRYRKPGGDRWKWGVAVPHPTVPPTWRIECLNSAGFGGFDADPWEILGHIIGDVEAFEWIAQPSLRWCSKIERDLNV